MNNEVDSNNLETISKAVGRRKISLPKENKVNFKTHAKKGSQRKQLMKYWNK